ncbi:MAG TPA: hypothetical protein P5123_13135, partial [Spirochaetota bacterium]|nr:hypothetical protein [Spirochaetota bacterium]
MKKRIIKNRITLGEAQPRVVVNENFSDFTPSTDRKKHVIQIVTIVTIFLAGITAAFYFIFLHNPKKLDQEPGRTALEDVNWDTVSTPSETGSSLNNPNLLTG